jgi:hypothetical protein
MWSDHKSVSQVQQHLKLEGLLEKAMLLLDNAPSHPNEKHSEIRQWANVLNIFYLT